MEKILVNSTKYDGQYVAIISAEDNTLVGAGNTPEEAFNEAKRKGIENPFLLYVPDKNMVQIYYAN